MASDELRLDPYFMVMEKGDLWCVLGFDAEGDAVEIDLLPYEDFDEAVAAGRRWQEAQ